MEMDWAYEDSIIENCYNNNNPHEPLLPHSPWSTGYVCPVPGAACMCNYHTRDMQSNQAKHRLSQKGDLSLLWWLSARREQYSPFLEAKKRKWQARD